MNLYAINHRFHYELENLTRAFIPNEKISVLSADELPEVLEFPYILTQMEDDICVTVKADGFEKNLKSPKTDDNELAMATLLYELLKEYTETDLAWGLLTGVRPVKLFRKLKSEQGLEKAQAYFRSKLLVSDAKINLSKLTCDNEQKILNLSEKKSFSLYISIPFCPTRCSYCSFVSQSVEKAKHLVDPYVELLCRELCETAKIAKDLGLKLETVYIGGGTPTSLEPHHLRKILTTVQNSFDVSSLREFTVEAGRPDTITEEKLRAILESGCDRLSVNPQTLNPQVLKIIGRNHTVEQFYDSFNLARKMGFKHINTDLIAGLPEDTAQSFMHTMEGILELSPESITIHTLSMKRSSALTGDKMKLLREDSLRVSEMLKFAYDNLSLSGYEPYYLYRQSKMVGNMENTGWSKPGFEGLYNVYIMDETHTILACGAGAVTKLKDPLSDNIERIFNFKYPYEYNDRFSELLQRKSAIKPFYEKIL
ncbi:MAG: coproporphyrinogen dehydrogenase HemZ [Eubacteriales bacterium]|nr:coproporphyrinogen dehydrogenase HemZ [Eubacteriales bacterium]